MFNSNGFLLASGYTDNLNTIKYFVEEQKIDITYIGDDYDRTGFKTAVKIHNNLGTVVYLAKYEEINIINNFYKNINIMENYYKNMNFYGDKQLLYINILLTYECCKLINDKVKILIITNSKNTNH